ncbi:MAG: Two-component DNA-binding response regulator [Candidatus Giovannonibacteria bacterium GW2011_GWC2_44_9]|uniref:Two-component DNA-binding response regulator n=3 Tax=Candidatus Giovannoniibacteriota TaxID=1752738 RepID=A0A0G1IXQ3_9BACT|nr:MAG: Two-component DNA-binding response regulator [Candidatus Giovannonibacteria bacterium GW2011_GWB1_44_23]KKT64146.1 MAG: Two-component DNA-binding response regulator [Candidatus Giovannonibacteria bacterium GW2011_GWA1_44_29]KKT84400.1 MAG: Two-component DNA-binding response regulator [Candidatus Giovannonibacteria bacterium GW2011_GWC2_44_9]KKT91746.1 MAG: Two-component DNA-binding response regulator [Parcubacteria group bacterium GW2011_GWC1_45_13]
MNPNIKVLIVDDDVFLLDMYSIKFKESGFSVEIAKNGEDALAKAKSLNPDIILLDIVMPKMDGFDVLREIKQNNIAPNAVIFILTNLGQKEDVDRGLKLGANDYIVKAHFTPSEVVAKVRSFLGPRQSDDFHL